MTSPIPLTVPQASRRSPPRLEVMFFGPPRSGKSELFHAFSSLLSKDAEEEPVPLMTANVDHPNGPLFPQVLLVDLNDDHPIAGKVVLRDCDSQAAQKILSNPYQVSQRQVNDLLLRQLYMAHALIFVIPANWDDASIRQQFDAFDSFLKSFHELRAKEREASGWPVFLVLTKCDQLIQMGDHADTWLRRVQTREIEVKERFREWFGSKIQGDDLIWSGFGSLWLDSIGVSTQMPNLPSFSFTIEDIAGPTFNVGKLVQRVLPKARIFHDRQLSAAKRLKWTMRGSLFLLGLMTIGLLLLSLLVQPGPVVQLTNQIEQYKRREGPTEVRLSDRQIGFNAKELEQFAKSEHFDELPTELQNFVSQRREEITDYTDYRRKFLPPQFSPTEIRTKTDYLKVQEELSKELQPPPTYAKVWEPTEAVQLLKKWQKDLTLLTQKENQLHDWYRDLISQASTLMLVEVPTATWREEVQNLVTSSQTTPFDPNAIIEDSPSVNVRRGQPMRYSVVFAYERSQSAQRDWNLAREKLKSLQALTDALGLTTDPQITPTANAPAALLSFSAPPSNPQDSLVLAQQRMQALQDRFPERLQDKATWTVSNFPDPIRQELARRLSASADFAILHVHRMILKESRLLDGSRRDSTEIWEDIANEFLKTPEIQAWGEMIGLLLRWSDRAILQENPVNELQKFLLQKQFEWTPQTIEVYLPNSLRAQSIQPDEVLQIRVTVANQREQVWKFERQATTKTTPQGVTYRYASERRTVIAMPITAKCEAELPFRAGPVNYRLRWNQNRSQVFSFEALTLEPTLEVREGVAAAQRATNVELKFLPDQQAVQMPILFPEIPVRD